MAIGVLVIGPPGHGQDAAGRLQSPLPRQTRHGLVDQLGQVQHRPRFLLSNLEERLPIEELAVADLPRGQQLVMLGGQTVLPGLGEQPGKGEQLQVGRVGQGHGSLGEIFKLIGVQRAGVQVAQQHPQGEFPVVQQAIVQPFGQLRQAVLRPVAGGMGAHQQQLQPVQLAPQILGQGGQVAFQFVGAERRFGDGGKQQLQFPFGRAVFDHFRHALHRILGTARFVSRIV